MTCVRTNTGGKLQRQRKPKQERFFEILFEDCFNKTSSEITLGKGVMGIKVSLQTQIDQDLHTAASAGYSFILTFIYFRYS
jgi:hypothetical protein